MAERTVDDVFAALTTHGYLPDEGLATAGVEDELYSKRFLVRRPLLQAIDYGEGPPPVLLVDEVDRADDEFEAFLLEILSDYEVTVPELGTFRAPPTGPP